MFGKIFKLIMISCVLFITFTVYQQWERDNKVRNVLRGMTIYNKYIADKKNGELK